LNTHDLSSHERFERIVTDWLQSATPSSGDNLLGFDLDLFYALMKSTYFSHITTRQTGDPRAMIVAICRLRPKCRATITLPDDLITLWENDIGYRAAKAYDVQYDGKKLFFRFATRMGFAPTDLCVTGSIVVSGVLLSARTEELTRNNDSNPLH
jgi:hypothetical protein